MPFAVTSVPHALLPSASALSFVEIPGGRDLPCRFARSFLRRLRGLLATRPDCLGGGVLCLEPCSSIHTFGMAYPIDVAFLDECDIVVAARRRVGPGRMLSAPRATCVLERPADGTSWLIAGDAVRFLTCM